MYIHGDRSLNFGGSMTFNHGITWKPLNPLVHHHVPHETAIFGLYPMFEQTHIYIYIYIITVIIRPNTLICPRLSAAIFVCAENVLKMEVFCIMANFMFYIGTHSIGTCASLLHIIIIIIIIIIIKPFLKIFNECRSLTGMGE